MPTTYLFERMGDFPLARTNICWGNHNPTASHNQALIGLPIILFRRLDVQRHPFILADMNIAEQLEQLVGEYNTAVDWAAALKHSIEVFTENNGLSTDALSEYFDNIADGDEMEVEDILDSSAVSATLTGQCAPEI
jgi:hypothetical protein